MPKVRIKKNTLAPLTIEESEIKPKLQSEIYDQENKVLMLISHPHPQNYSYILSFKAKWNDTLKLPLTHKTPI